MDRFNLRAAKNIETSGCSGADMNCKETNKKLLIMLDSIETFVNLLNDTIWETI